LDKLKMASGLMATTRVNQLDLSSLF